MRLLVVLAPLLLAAATAGASPAAAATRPAPPPLDQQGERSPGVHRIALTFDDLPVHAGLPPGTSRAEVVRGIITALRERHAPPCYGFVNAKDLAPSGDTAEVLRLWREAGHRLGNHTYSHLDLHAATVAAFEHDVIADEPALRARMAGGDWHWLRFPYLHEGETLEKRRAVARFLKSRGYRVAQVTLSPDDWAYNDAYPRCVERNDQQAIGWMKESYRRRVADSLRTGPEAAQLVFGRDIAHVMVLHNGAFQALMLPELLRLVDESGYRLVTLQEAQRDPAYARAPAGPFPSGGTFIDQVAQAKGIALPRRADDTLAKLAGLCR